MGHVSNLDYLRDKVQNGTIGWITHMMYAGKMRFEIITRHA